MLSVESVLSKKQQQGFGRLIDATESVKQSIDHMHETNERSLKEVVTSFTGFKDYTAGLEQSAKDLALFNEGLSENLGHFQELFQQMKAVTNGFSEGTNELNKNFKSLFTYFKKADRRNERLKIGRAHV